MDPLIAELKKGLERSDRAVALRRLYAVKIRVALNGFDDPNEREVAEILTGSGDVGVLRDLKHRVRMFSTEFVT